MLRQYLNTRKFKRHIPNWIIVIILLYYFYYIAEPSKPFYRQFSLDDISISHPFSTVERISDNQLYLLSCLLPTTVIILVCLTLKVDNYSKIHLMQISLLGLWLSLSINGVVTDILKNWIGRPRPDFLERCGPKSDTPFNILVDVSVCTLPLGEVYLIDGMKSTPSGHSSISFSGLAYLTLWLYGQFKVMHRNQLIYKTLVCSLPLLLACYIALSRVQDYRHHFFDIFFGTLLGCFFAIFIYHRFFNYIWCHESSKPMEDDDKLTLPS